MQVYYTERIEGNRHWFEFAPQLRYSVAVDRIDLQDHRLGGDIVMEYTAREAAEKLWQTLQELAQDKQGNVRFIKVDELDMKTLNEKKRIAECQAFMWKMIYDGATARRSEKEKELNHLRILYRNHFKRQRRKSRKKTEREVIYAGNEMSEV